MKIVSLLLYVFCVGALTTIGWAIVAMGVSFCACRIARFPLRFVGKRVAVVGGFLGMFFFVMPLTVKTLPSDVLYAIEGLAFLRFNPRGLAVAALAFFKATAIVAMVLPMVGTAPFPVTIRALEGLKVPAMVVQMILMSYRYLFVFTSEMQRMATAMSARGFKRRTDLKTLRTIGNFVGVLLVRSFERTERVYEAMLSRGYTGKIRTLETPAVGTGDLCMGGIWAGLGFALVALDRLVSVDPLRAIL